MANLDKKPGDDASGPVESRRTTASEADAPQTAPAEAGVESTTDLPDLGEFSPEAARPTPLDEITAAERESMPRD